MASIFRRLRLGFGNRPDSYGPEKSWLAGIDFRKGSDTGTIDFNGTDWDVSVNGVQTGSIPGGGGGGSVAGVTAVIGAQGGPNLQVGDQQSVVYAPAARTFLSWEITLYPAGTVEVDVLKNGVSMCTGGARPEITTGTSASGDVTGWASTTVAIADSLAFVITVITGSVERVDVLLSPEPP